MADDDVKTGFAVAAIVIAIITTGAGAVVGTVAAALTFGPLVAAIFIVGYGATLCLLCLKVVGGGNIRKGLEWMAAN